MMYLPMEQSFPVYPALQKHVPLVQVPCPEQLLGQLPTNCERDKWATCKGGDDTVTASRESVDTNIPSSRCNTGK